MKAKELRIGNLVQFEGEFHTIASIGSDETIRLRCEDSTHRNYCHGTIGCYGMYSIDPIPLTEEWLLKFGFISNPYEDRYEKGLIHVECDKTKGATYLWINNMPHIKHIHQLQNLYFAITGEELTIGGNNE